MVVVFHHGNACIHCWENVKELAQAYDNVAELEAEILAVSFNILETLKIHAEKLGIPFPLLSDEMGETTEKFTYPDVRNHAPLSLDLHYRPVWSAATSRDSLRSPRA